MGLLSQQLVHLVHIQTRAIIFCTGKKLPIGARVEVPSSITYFSYEYFLNNLLGLLPFFRHLGSWFSVFARRCPPFHQPSYNSSSALHRSFLSSYYQESLGLQHAGIQFFVYFRFKFLVLRLKELCIHVWRRLNRSMSLQIYKAKNCKLLAVLTHAQITKLRFKSYK